MDATLKKQARARLLQMKQAADDMTAFLGLPKEATYDVMAMMYGEAPSSLVVQRMTQQQTSDASLKARIFSLSEGFVNTQMKPQLTLFRSLWDRLKALPLETLGKGLGQRPTAATGLGFADSSQQLLTVISVISWAVVQYPVLRKTNTPEQIQTVIAREAEGRGCSRALSNALALYIQPHLGSR